MKERPILFSAPMVRALLAGTKTQTRRMVKPQPRILAGELLCWKDDALTDDQMAELCPYGQPGDRLWVREAWMDLRGVDGAVGPCMYRATFGNAPDGGKWRPSIHMPRWASRITLEVTGMRVERLQDITRGDAMAEGCPFPNLQDGDSPVRWYEYLWRAINGPDSWDANPWVWVVEFKRMEMPA